MFLSPTTSSSYILPPRTFGQAGQELMPSPPSIPRPSSDHPTLSKVGRLMRRKSQSSKHSDLTEENVEAHNRRNASYCNYKGSLAWTPERRSHATSTVATSSSFSTFIAKMRRLGSCLKRDNSELATYTKMKAGRSPLKEMIEKRKEMSENNSFLVKEKPLRERVPAAAAAAAPAPPPTLTLPSTDHQVMNEKDSNEREFMWADKYQPKALEDFICNRDKAMELRDLVRDGECCHLIFEGPPGAGKRTMIWAVLREAFGADRVQATEEYCKAFKLKGEMIGKIQVNVKQSPQHVEVNLSELKGYEKHVIVELIKETQNMTSDKALPCGSNNCRAIILYEADNLSTDALLYIRWLLERYKGCNKIFFSCSDVSKLEPITSLCKVVQLAPPSNKEIVQALEFISKQECVELPLQLTKRIAEKSKNNLRQAIRSFEASWKNNYPFKQDQVILTGWEDCIANIAKNIVEEQSPRQLYKIRGKLQNLMEHDVSPDFIFKSLVGELKRYLPKELQQRIDNLHEEYRRVEEGMFKSEKPLAFSNYKNDSMRRNVQQFPRIEEFIARFMSCYKSSITNNIIAQHDESTLHKGTSYSSLAQPNHLI